MSIFEKLVITELANPEILRCVNDLPNTGVVCQTVDYCYLKIDDAYIHRTYPLLSQYHHIDKPDYFNPDNEIGAHISIIYPEENVALSSSTVPQIHTFSVKRFMKAKYGQKEYFVLTVAAPSLTAIRKGYHLPAKPIFKAQAIVFHITIGVRPVVI